MWGMLPRPVVRATTVGWSKTVAGFKLVSKNFCKALMTLLTELVGRDWALVEINDALSCIDGQWEKCCVSEKIQANDAQGSVDIHLES